MSNSTPSTAKDFLPPSVLDLARLAAILNPKACISEAKAALAAAACLYIEAKVYWDKHASQPAHEFIAEVAGTNLLSELLYLIEKADAERAEKEKLRLYPKKSTDAVREKLGVKKTQSVRMKLKDHFTSLENNERIDGKFDEFWKSTRRTDENSLVYYAFDIEYLESVLSWSRNNKRKGGYRSLAARKGKIDPKNPSPPQ